MTKAQSSLEFVLIISFVLLSFSSFLVFYNLKLVDVQKQKNYDVLEDRAEVIKSEVQMASIVEDGYIRNFYLPPDLGDLNYTITYRNGSSLGDINFSIFEVGYTNDELSIGEYVFFLYPNVTGTFKKGEYNKISKDNGVVCINC